MKKDCKNCANMGKTMCRTMQKIPTEKWCFMTIEDAIKAEEIILKRLNTITRNGNIYKAKKEAIEAIKMLKQKQQN